MTAILREIVRKYLAGFGKGLIEKATYLSDTDK